MLVKICGLTTLNDAILVADAGADFMGIVMARSSARRATADNARAILEAGFTQRIFLVFGYDDADYIRESFTALASSATGLQIMADHPQIEELLKLAPTSNIMPSISAAEKVTAAQLARWEHHPLVLFDSHRASPLPSFSTMGRAGRDAAGGARNEAGGTGRTFDPANIAGIKRPFLYAGGLTPDNVAGIVRQVNPAGVDVASGTEAAPGIKDAVKVKRFVENAKRAAYIGLQQ